MVDHFFLEQRNLAKLATGSHNELEFVGRMYRSLSYLARAEDVQHETGSRAHPENKGPGQGEENLHGSRDRQGYLLAALQSQRLRNQFPKDHVQAGDEDECDADGNPVGVNLRVGDLAERFREDTGQHGFADKTESQAYDCDSQLNTVDYFVEVSVQLLDNAGADAPGFDQLLNAGFANADQGEFGRGKERVGCDQEQNQKHPDQHKCDHGCVILTFQRQYRSPLRAKAL